MATYNRSPQRNTKKSKLGEMSTPLSKVDIFTFQRLVRTTTTVYMYMYSVGLFQLLLANCYVIKLYHGGLPP